MQHRKKNVLVNPCQEKWEHMSGDKSKRMCLTCQEHVYDATRLDLETIASEFLDAGKCVQINESQQQFFQFMRSLPKVATLSAALALYPFANAQDSTTINIEMSRVYGRVEEGRNANRTIYVIVDGKTYETKTDDRGFFAINVPRNVRIEDSNVKQLCDRKVRKKQLELKDADLPMDAIMIGSF